ncbi:hypothetical protein UlMin_025203 [Ulmus minor]
MAHSINDSNIVLIPKKPNPTRPNHFRPISVCNVTYQKKKGTLEWMALKINLEKAYDRGDPLFPYLFILCTEILSRLFISKVDNGAIHGLKLTKGGPPLHHLMFADDIFVFGKACATEASSIKDTLDSFCFWSGLSFNNSKSSIFFSANTRRVVANQLTSLLDCLDSKLARWKSKLLSKASRLTLIKSMALSLPIYAMHTAKIPKAICAKLDARIQRFWWGSKDDNPRPLYLKAWDNLYLLTGKSSQCLLFLQGKYLRSASFKTVEASPTDSRFRKAILKSRTTLLRRACLQIRDGFSINIWEDPWVPNVRIIKDLIFPSGQWDTRKVLSIFQPSDANAILSIHLAIRPAKDHWCWLPANSGKFLARSFYLSANNHTFSSASNIPKKVWLSLWSANILPQHKILWWQILSNYLSMRTRIHRCLPDIDTQCSLCANNSESALHLLFYCDIVKLVWFASPWNIRSDNLSFANPLKIWLFASIMFDMVWRSRNEVVHGGCIPDPVMLIRKILKSFYDTKCTLMRSVFPPVFLNPPLQDWLKFSMDTAVGVSCSSTAVVVCNLNGALLFWKSTKVLSTNLVFVEARDLLLVVSNAVSLFASTFFLV